MLLRKDRLSQVHPLLRDVVLRAAELEGPDILVVEGARSVQRQRLLVETGRSKTLKSRHLVGEAVDICVVVDGLDRWTVDFFLPLRDRVMQAARELGAKITWGGDWKGFQDCPHFQIELT